MDVTAHCLVCLHPAGNETDILPELAHQLLERRVRPSVLILQLTDHGILRG